MNTSVQPTFMLVIYDISDDERRTAMAKALKRLGLTRVQRSAFIGPAKHALISEVKNAAKRIIDESTDNVQIYPLTPASYNLRIEMGKEFREEEGFEAGYIIS